MKISNFNLIEVIGDNALNWKFRATVDVTTGIFKKTTTKREIFKNYAGYWYFADNGQFTPKNDVECLVRAFEAKQGENIEQIKKINFSDQKTRKQRGDK